MKASTYKQQARGQKMSRCDKKLGVTRVTPKPNRGREQLSLLTRMCSIYILRLSMSNIPVRVSLGSI